MVFQDFIKTQFGDNPPKGFGIAFQDFQDIYLHSSDISKSTVSGSIRGLQIFGVVGLLILIISLLNYVNLSTAKGVTRAKEVGIRKVLGSEDRAIFNQFMVESVFFTVTSGIAAFLLVWLLLPVLNQISQFNLSISLLGLQDYILLFLALIFLGMLAGILPALMLSKLPSLSKTEDQSIQFKVKEWPLTRKVFVGIQYFVALALMVATLVVYQQYNYLKNYDLGFNSEQLLRIPVEDKTMQGSD